MPNMRAIMLWLPLLITQKLVHTKTKDHMRAQSVTFLHDGRELRSCEPASKSLHVISAQNVTQNQYRNGLWRRTLAPPQLLAWMYRVQRKPEQQDGINCRSSSSLYGQLQLTRAPRVTRTPLRTLALQDGALGRVSMSPIHTPHQHSHTPTHMQTPQPAHPHQQHVAHAARLLEHSVG